MPFKRMRDITPEERYREVMSALAPRPKVPSAKFNSVGRQFAVSGVVMYEPETRQAREYQKTTLAYTQSGNPIMETRVILRQDNGELVAIYAKLGLAFAITDALVEAEAPDVEVGGRLTAWWDHNDPESKNPANPRKVYKAEYVPAPDPAGGDWDPGEIE